MESTLPIHKELSILDEQEAKLAIQKSLILKKALTSTDVDSIYKAQAYLQGQRANSTGSNFLFNSNLQQKQGQPGSHKSLIFDPFETNTSQGFFQKMGAVSFELLRQMARTPIINAIISTRKDQVAEFCVPQADKYSKGFVFKKIGKDKKYSLTDSDKRKIDELTKFIMNCADDEEIWDLDDLDAVIRKIVDDSLSMDQSTFEVVFNRFQEPIQFLAVDAATIRIADSYDNVNNTHQGEEKNGYYPSYVQIYQNRIYQEYYPWEMCMGIRNPQTELKSNGYGKSELEILISMVTSMLNSDAYNSKFFQNGTAPKGALLVKSAGGVNKDKIAELRRDWNSTMAGVNNFHKTPVLDAEKIEWLDLQKCLDRSTSVISKTKGLISFESLLGQSREIFDELWDGEKFSKAHIFTTSPKQLCEVELYNRIKIKSSPNHRFLCLRDNDSIWIEQKDLKIGDLLFINKKIDSSVDSLQFNNLEVEEDLLELMGWIIGDGYIGDDLPSKRMISTFYHPEKELDIRLMHKDICLKYGINFKEGTDRRKINETINGFTAKYSEYPRATICDINFYKWYRSLGFTTSREKKTIPSILYQLPSNLKCAFLRGFFSADGHISKDGFGISITISNKKLREQVIELLLSESIRSCKTQAQPKAIIVQDNELFMQKVNFIQKYKKDRERIRTRNGNGKDFYPVNFVYHIARQVKQFNKSLDFPLTGKELVDLLNISKGYNRGSLTKVIQYGDVIDFPHPKFFDNYYLSPVISLKSTNEEIEMVDVEMNNDTHAFYANGFIVHNSNRDMEFSKYQEYLIKIGCAVYKISPEEIGFPLQGTNGSGLNNGGSGKQEEKDYSINKGLKPLLKSLKTWLNKFIVLPKSGGEFELDFVGLDTEDSQAEEERLLKAATVYMTVDEVRSIRELEPLPDGKGNVILSPIMMQQAQMEMQKEMMDKQQQQGSEEAGQESDNPFAKALVEWWDKNMKQVA